MGIHTYTITRNAAGSNPALIANRTYEGTRDALKTIENKAGASVVSSYTYNVNSLGQRDSVTTSGSAFGVDQNFIPADWTWGYDSLGQLAVADSPTAAHDRAFDYDFIGNRKKFAHGTTTLPQDDNYTANPLNQYTQVPSYTPQPAHDDDGNLTSGPVPGSAGNAPGVQTPANATAIQWDAENRLVSATVGGTTVITYQYDYLSRLIRRQVNSYTPVHYHYDGWNRIAEYSGDSLNRTYTWGLDLSGTMQGAGGVGGLLVNRIGSTNYCPFYDGNGNITEYMTEAGGLSAHFEYDPFGTLTRRSGLITFTYRFSTKPRDTSTGLYYYGYRYYDPLTGRWPSRDPIGERGGVNHYSIISNDLVNEIDYLGMLKAGDLIIVGAVVEAWEAAGWVFAPRLARHALDSGGNRDAQPDEINELKTHSSFTKHFKDSFFKDYACKNGVGTYTKPPDSDTLVNYSFAGRAALSDIGSAYGQVIFDLKIQVTKPGIKHKVKVTFKFTDTYDFSPGDSLNPVHAFNRLQQADLASVFDSSGEFEKEYEYCCKKRWWWPF